MDSTSLQLMTKVVNLYKRVAQEYRDNKINRDEIADEVGALWAKVWENGNLEVIGGMRQAQQQLHHTLDSIDYVRRRHELAGDPQALRRHDMIWLFTHPLDDNTDLVPEETIWFYQAAAWQAIKRNGFPQYH